jgi:hypothetical protein
MVEPACIGTYQADAFHACETTQPLEHRTAIC